MRSPCPRRFEKAKRFSLGALLPAFVVMIALSGCQRPFADEGTPGIAVISPDLSLGQSEPDITLQVDAQFAFSSVTRVELGDTEMTYDGRTQTWFTPVTLQVGLNTLILTSYPEDGDTGVDTVYALYMPHEIDLYPGVLPIPVGGHTATVIPSGDLLVIGGAEQRSGVATDWVQILRPQITSFSVLGTQLKTARVGHTATLLDDGQLLVVGGGAREEIASTAELVETVEIYSSENDDFVEIPVVGDPIRRMYHTASYRTTPDGTVLDLIGGTGDTRYGSQPVLGVRNDLRSFLLKNDTLYALHPGIGPLVDPMTGHSQTPLQFISPGEEGIYLLTGFVTDPLPEPASRVIDFTSPFGIEVFNTLPRHRPSIRLASERMRHGVVGLFGGIRADDRSPTNASEIFFWEIDTYFILPNDSSNSFSGRYGHTATIIGANRILIIGGFGENGAAINRPLIFDYSL